MRIYLAQGDIAAARLILGPAVEARAIRAPRASLAATYDPAVLKERRVLGFRPDLVAGARLVRKGGRLWLGGSVATTAALHATLSQ